MSGRRTVIVGAGGHAKVCVDILRRDTSLELAGVTCGPDGGAGALGLPLLGGDDVLPRLRAEGVECAFVALGDNRLRLDRIRALQALRFELVTGVHQRATIADDVQIGRGTIVMAGAVVNVATTIGDGVIVNTSATIDHDCRLGDGVHVAPGVHCAGCVTLGEGAMMGIGSCAVPGRSLGAWSTVGAGGVVISDVAAGSTVVGSPAQPIAAQARGGGHDRG
jgi:UDP-perosamine 4-acetyltransferase